MEIAVSSEIEYVFLILGLFFVAKFLQRFRVPGAITCLGIGVAFGLGFGLFQNDPVISVFSILGISILFLFAGMELDVDELKQDFKVIVGHIIVQTVLIGIVTFAAVHLLRLNLRPALLTALALLTPSTGFILDSLAKLGVSDTERVWIKSRAIATEIIALGILLFALQSTSGIKLGLSLAAVIGMIAVLPLVFRFFASFILPHAPKNEFAFLVVVALICATATKKLGVYYLVGAFIVGITEQRLRRKLPSSATEQTMHAVELFASFFIPFYFLKAGLDLRSDNFSFESFATAGVFLVVILPLRVLSVAVYRRISNGQPIKQGIRLGVSLLPTLVFTIVIAEILRDRFSASHTLVGGLILYTLVNTLFPSIALRTPSEEYDTPEAPGRMD